jgi:archaellum component FlaD/FlaE
MLVVFNAVFATASTYCFAVFWSGLVQVISTILLFAGDALEDEDEPEEAKALQEAAITQEEAGQEPDSQMKVSQQEEKQEAAETSEDTHPDTEEDVFADATSDDDETDDEFDGDILEGDVVEDNDSDDDVIQEDVVEEDIVEDVSDEAAVAETGTDKAKVAEVPEETAIDIYRVGQQSSSRVIARIQK